MWSRDPYLLPDLLAEQRVIARKRPRRRAVLVGLLTTSAFALGVVLGMVLS